MSSESPTSSTEKEKIHLTDVPETMLWPLWNRSEEQRRKNPVLVDPISADLASRIDYDYRSNFGKPNVSHPIRSRMIDDAIKEWIAKNPEGWKASSGASIMGR